MRVLVLGAGVAGLSVAYWLAKDGHQVTVLDQHKEVAHGGSFANGAQLSYSYVAPLASPAILANLPLWITAPDSPIRFQPGLDPHHWCWALRFLGACNRSRNRLTTRRLLVLSMMSRRLMHELIAEENLEFSYSRRGKLILYSDARSFEEGSASVAYQRQLGCEQRAVSTAECLELEPSLRHVRTRIHGGVFTPSDETGDCRLFCTEVTRILRSSRYGAQFLLDTTLQSFRMNKRNIAAAVTDGGEVRADAYVLALGSVCRKFTRPLGFDLPVVGLKGYSLTVPVVGDGAPQLSITDQRHKIVYARLGNHVRIAGLADFDRDERRMDPKRLALLRRRAEASFSDGLDYENLLPWMGARPVTPTGLPILGFSPTMANLLLNVGHGALGFTLAMATGKIVADRLKRQPVEPQMSSFVS